MSRLASMGMACAVASVALIGAFATADDKGGAKVGDKAPAFQATDDQGNVWKSSDHVGKKVVVLYFFPADFTGGCTKQACSFRDNLKDLEVKGAEVVGVSGDSAETHAMFKKAENLGFTLLADQKGTLAKKFGIPAGAGGTFKYKAPDGQVTPLVRGVTIDRWTVIIDRDGKIAKKYKVQNPAADSKKALQIIEKL